MSRTAAILLSLPLLVVSVSGSDEQGAFREVSFETADGGRIIGNLYERGDHAVVLAHGAVFDKESWQPFSRVLAKTGLTVLAIDFRGYGNSVAGSRAKALKEDVLAAIRYLREAGSETVSVVGGSMGGTAAARAAMDAEPGEIDRLVLLAPGPLEKAALIKANHVLFVVAKGDRLLPAVEQSYTKTPDPKRLEILEGDAHAQHIFKSDRGARLTEILLADLTDRPPPGQP
jgi:alpha-beta hydrolase superfamily lysophospholipase